MTAGLFVVGLIGPGLPTNAYTTLKEEDEDAKVVLCVPIASKINILAGKTTLSGKYLTPLSVGIYKIRKELQP